MRSIDKLFIEGISVRADRMPFQVWQKSKQCLLDYLGVLVGGMKFLSINHPKLIEAFDGRLKLDGAMLDGFAAHVLELDDGHRHGMIHLGASVITPVLAISEKENLSSDSTLMGIVMGYEAAVRCARAIQQGIKYVAIMCLELVER